MEILAILTPLCLSAMALSAQAPTAPQKSPKQVVEEYWKMETEGGMLKYGGWYSASHFFIDRNPGLPAISVLRVLEKDHKDTIEEVARTDHWAEVFVWSYEVGQIDMKLRFIPTPKRGPHGVILMPGPIRFDLVLTDKHWEIDQDGGRSKELSGPPQWLIGCSDSRLWVNLDVAIQHVMEMRDKASDSAIKKNANQTLSVLNRLMEPSARHPAK